METAWCQLIVIMWTEITNMLEYVLFHQKPFEIFVKFLKENELSLETSENDGIYEIRIDEDIDKDLSEKVEAEYDRLVAMNQELFFAENPATDENYRMASVMITLKNGDRTSAHLPPELLARVLDAIDETEPNEIITAVVKAVENPDERSYCQKVRSGEVSFNDDWA